MRSTIRGFFYLFLGFKQNRGTQRLDGAVYLDCFLISELLVGVKVIQMTKNLGQEMGRLTRPGEIRCGDRSGCGNCQRLNQSEALV